MNILKSIHLIHIPEAFSKAETQLHVGILQSRAFDLDAGKILVNPPFYGVEKLQGAFQAVQTHPAHPGTFLYLFISFFWAIVINNVCCMYMIC